MIVIVDGGNVVRKFGITENAFGYAESMMLKKHDVWVISIRVAHSLGLI